jgi:bacterial leucyl aminopeptidase
MKKTVSNLLATSALTLATMTAFAGNQQVVIAPSCLASKLTAPHQTLASKDDFILLSISKQNLTQLITLKNTLQKSCGGFINVSHAWKTFTGSPTAFLNTHLMQPLVPQKKYKIKYEKQVNQLLGTINPQNMWDNLTTLTSFEDRYADSDNGIAAANWIKTQIETIAKASHHDDVTTFFVDTDDYKQPSLVVKVGKGDEPGIVIGGHMDTLEKSFFGGNKPGADDDGSGTVTVLETARNLLTSGMTFKKPIYFIWYAAEEEGLYGSQAVVEHFKKNKIAVDAVIQLDMTGYAYQNEQTIWLINDHVDKKLTKFLETLIKTYVKQPVNYTACNYGCSDHASWTNGGFAASMPFETAFGNDDPYIHSSDDKMDYLSLNHMTDFVKLASAFAVELAEPVS